ncbi:MAG: SGNH/GDSL hydrolase family protein [Planctomycetota bacterium]
MKNIRIGPRTAVLLVAAVVVVTEVGLRATGRFVVEARFEPSARYGHRLVGEQERKSARGVAVRINSAGFRDREWTDADRSGVRIAVLGDSVSFGHDVAEDRVWCRLLESSLRAREAVRESAGRHIVVQNFSVPGYGIEHSARVFDDVIAPTRPALVVITVAPYAIPPLEERHEPALSAVRRWIQRTAIVQCVARARGRTEPEPPVDRLRVDAETTPGSPVVADAALWDAALARIDGIRRELERTNGRLVLVSTPLVDATIETRPASRFETWASAHPDVVWIDPTRALSAAMEPLLNEMKERELVLSDVWTPLAANTRLAHADSAVFFLDDAFHLNARGHQVVAGVVERALAQAGVP